MTVQKSMEMLREYRTALISEGVRQEIDLRDRRVMKKDKGEA
jgi:hypothetical protein